MEIIDEVSINECDFWEQYWIDQLRSWGFDLTNIACGGRGGNLGFNVNKKISEKLKGRILSEEWKNKIRFAKTGTKASNETKKKFSETRLGDKNPNFGKKTPESSKTYKKIIQLNRNGEVLNKWKGIIVASKELKIHRCTINDVLNGRKKTAGGFKWVYDNE